MVLYAPGDTKNIYGHEQQERHSPVDPLALDLVAYPSARAATAHVAVLDEGETLLVPAGWWQSAVSLDRCVSLQVESVCPFCPSARLGTGEAAA